MSSGHMGGAAWRKSYWREGGRERGREGEREEGREGGRERGREGDSRGEEKVGGEIGRQEVTELFNCQFDTFCSVPPQ